MKKLKLFICKIKGSSSLCKKLQENIYLDKTVESYCFTKMRKDFYIIQISNHFNLSIGKNIITLFDSRPISIWIDRIDEQEETNNDYKNIFFDICSYSSNSFNKNIKEFTKEGKDVFYYSLCDFFKRKYKKHALKRLRSREED